MPEKIIEISKLSRRIGNQYLLKNIDWTVNKGDRWVVFGANGSGKTTLLSILSGFSDYEMGSCKILGKEQREYDLDELRMHIGWVSSSFFDKYYQKELVRDIILSGKTGSLGIRGQVENKDFVMVRKLLRAVNLEDKIEAQYNMLSKGQQQTILLIRAMMSHPEIIILDEPCTGLDVLNREKVFNLLRQLSRNEELTIIYVTHYLEEIIEVFDQGLLLKNGEIFNKGMIQDVFTSKEISNFFESEISIVQKDNQINAVF